MLQNIDNYLRNKSIILYSLLYAFAVYLFVIAKDFRVGTDMGLILNAMYFVDFGVHESSHIVTIFLPTLYNFLAGSVGQVSYVLAIIAVSIYKKAYFFAIMAGVWIVMTLQSIGRYISDAREQSIPLADFGQNPQHDFHYILGQLNLLEKDDVIGSFVANIGIVIGIVSLIFGGLLILRLIYLRLSRRSML